MNGSLPQWIKAQTTELLWMATIENIHLSVCLSELRGVSVAEYIRLAHCLAQHSMRTMPPSGPATQNVPMREHSIDFLPFGDQGSHLTSFQGLTEVEGVCVYVCCLGSVSVPRPRSHNNLFGSLLVKVWNWTSSIARD